MEKTTQKVALFLIMRREGGFIHQPLFKTALHQSIHIVKSLFRSEVCCTEYKDVNILEIHKAHTISCSLYYKL